MLQMGYYARAHLRDSFRITGSIGRLLQKFGVLLDPLTRRFTQAMSGRYLHVRKWN